MRLVILAGGLGTRISEGTDYFSKLMLKIGKRLVIFHIMKY
jgi:NDP-sugar pyrophosphorylase family protein